MKRLATVLAAAVIAVLLVVALAYVLLPRDALKTRIAEQISAWTGRDVSQRGEPEISFFPRLSVTLKDVEVGGPPGMEDAGLMTVDELRGTIRLLPLLIGRVEVQSFHMLRPKIHLVRGLDARRNWALDAGAAALQLAFAGDVPLGNFGLEDGTLVYDDLASGRHETFEGINVTVDWLSIRQPFSLGGAATWRGEPVRLSVSAGDPFAFLNRRATPVQAAIEAAPLHLAFTGEASGIRDLRVTGTLQTSTPSLIKLAAWSGYGIGEGALPGAASLAGTASFEAPNLTVADARLDVDGNAATGALTIAFADRPSLSGTLAFGALNLTPYLNGDGSPGGAATAWRQKRLRTAWFDDYGADVRLSASSLSAGAIVLGPTAATVSLRDGALDLGIGEAGFYGGTVSGDLIIRDSDSGPGAAVQARLRAGDVVLADAAAPLGLRPDVKGTLGLAGDVQSHGVTYGEAIANLAGTSAVKIADGALPWLGLGEMAANTPAAAPGSPTQFSTLTAQMHFAAARAIVETASVVAPAYTAQLSGEIGLDDGSLAIAGRFEPPPASGASAFSIEGTIARPVPRPVVLEMAPPAEAAPAAAARP